MFKVLENGKMPTRGSKYSACVDLYASEDVIIGAGETVMVGLGVCVDIDWNVIDYNFNSYIKREQDRIKSNFLNSHYLQLMLRSSLGKKGLIIPNGVGVIDLDYKDEIKVLIHNPVYMTWADEHINTESGLVYNLSDGKDFKINKGDRIAQITLLEHKSYLFGIGSDEVRDGGFGSTGEVQ